MVELWSRQSGNGPNHYQSDKSRPEGAASCGAIYTDVRVHLKLECGDGSVSNIDIFAPAHTYDVCALVRRFSSYGRSFPSHESPNYSLSSAQDPVDSSGIDYTCQGTPKSLRSSCYS
ncbi:hypothetical protein IG631_12518 [Alternaria alternata]|nr:hypothetical protein IG631_12518 [Alternaria alternata]